MTVDLRDRLGAAGDRHGKPVPGRRLHGLRALFTAIDALSSDPPPATSLPFGSPDLRRIRVGRYRALYQVSDDEQLIVVTHLGRSG